MVLEAAGVILPACTGHIEKAVCTVYPVGARYDRRKPRREKNGKGQSSKW